MTAGPSFDIPRGRVVPVERVEVRLDPAPHPFELGHAREIEANWQREVAANPALFDGRMVLLSALCYEGGRLRGRCHEVRFATMLYWRRNKAAADVEHCFAHAALVSGDNALVAIRMGRHTANPGRVYFAAGSFERQDFIGGLVDVYGNMRREVAEETGLDLADFQAEPRYYFYSGDHSTVLIQRYLTREPADAVARRIESHVAVDAEPEIQGPVVIREADDLPDGVLPHMAAIIRWHFSEATPQPGK
ncbi:MAG: hypothetical protein J0H34_06915 [Rhizobiales bacterium]|nr:hypothetical protein [Hyphomicrobiales bacterium]